MAWGPRVTISAFPWHLMQKVMEEVIRAPVFRMDHQVEGHSPTTLNTAVPSSTGLAKTEPLPSPHPPGEAALASG